MKMRPTLHQRLQYAFDNLMSRGTPALVGGLAALSLIMVLLAAFVIRLGGTALAPEGSGTPMPFLEAFWDSLMRTLDPGTMGGDQGWGFRLVMLVVTVGGIFIVSALIGVLSSGLDQRLDQLQKGRSQVLESGHTVILGWSPQIFTILSELMIANENQTNARIVILANQDKVEMEDEVRERVPQIGSTKIIVRSGNPIDLTDLEIASPHSARSIIVLPPDGDNPDTYVIKTVLAITNNPTRHPEPYHIVTQIHDQKNRDVVEMVGGNDRVQAVLSGDLIARVVAQTSRQSGLSVVYTELLNFGGDEIYFTQEPTLVGKSYGEALLAYEDSCVMGLEKPDGTIRMNPPMDTPIEAGDKLFALSADDDTVRVSGLAEVPLDADGLRANGSKRRLTPEKTMILGWNECAATIIRELDHYVAKGSRVMVVADVDDQQVKRELKECCQRMPNQKVTFLPGDTTSRRLLESLKADEYDHMIVLSYAGLEVQEADAKTLVTLLHLRDIAETDATPFSIVSEMLDLRNRQLAEVAHVDDFIVSAHLVSLMMSQLSENADLYAVFEDIFNAEGSEIYLKPIGEYIETGRPVNFYTLVEAARQRGQTAFGYRLVREAGDAARSYGVHTNPKKSEMITFFPEDKLIVIAED
jgi:voltage-gated potassium channel Kch